MLELSAAVPQLLAANAHSPCAEAAGNSLCSPAANAHSPCAGAASNSPSVPAASNSSSSPAASNSPSVPAASNSLSVPAASNSLSIPAAEPQALSAIIAESNSLKDLSRQQQQSDRLHQQQFIAKPSEMSAAETRCLHAGAKGSSSRAYGSRVTD